MTDSESRKLYNQAALYRAQALNEDAEAFYIQSIALAQREFGEKHPQVAQSLYGLAVLYDLLDDKRAASVYKKAKTARGNSKNFSNAPGLHLELAQAYCLRTASSLMENIKKYDDANYYLHKVESIIENILGPNDPEIANIYFCLSKIYDKQGNQKQAETSLQKAWAIKVQHGVVAKREFNRKIYNQTHAVRRIAEKAREKELSAVLWLNHVANIFSACSNDQIEMHAKTLGDIQELLEEQLHDAEQVKKTTSIREKSSVKSKPSAKSSSANKSSPKGKTSSKLEPKAKKKPK